jgi:hypothetical protein
MTFCPVVPEICRGQVHGPRKERRRIRIIIIKKFCVFKISRCLPFSKWLPKYGIKMGSKNSTLSDIIKI